jgi:catechol 2,3-dioxygenase-like lactoylglutathione lyase family enzyme
MRIKLAGVFVDDQDRALAFYTNVLGFQKKDDAPYSETARWLTVVAPEDPDGTELLLGVPTDAARDFQKAQREIGAPATSFSTDDIDRDYQALRAKGVSFVMEPTKMDYGGTDAVFDDTCGNLINLHQD